MPGDNLIRNNGGQDSSLIELMELSKQEAKILFPENPALFADLFQRLNSTLAIAEAIHILLARKGLASPLEIMDCLRMANRSLIPQLQKKLVEHEAIRKREQKGD